MYPAPSAGFRITRDAKEVIDADTVLAVMYLICIMNALHLLDRYHGTGELHEYVYLRLVAQRSTTVGDLPEARPGRCGGRVGGGHPASRPTGSTTARGQSGHCLPLCLSYRVSAQMSQPETRADS